MQQYKETTIKGVLYRVGRLKARDGAFVLQRVEKAASNGLSESEFHDIEDHCLAVCQKFDELAKSFMPIFVKDAKRFAYEELEYDTFTVTQLTKAAIDFNLESFIQGAAQSNPQPADVPGSPSPSSQA